jgi:hypothetical protein
MTLFQNDTFDEIEVCNGLSEVCGWRNAKEAKDNVEGWTNLH